MLQLPINVYPHNVTIDTTNIPVGSGIQFIFKGDTLKAYVVRFYNYNTDGVAVNDTAVYDYDPQNLFFRNIAYNNSTVKQLTALNVLPLNNEYIMKIMLIEGTVQQSGIETNRFVLRGQTIEAASYGDNVLKIEDKINSIYEWDLSPTNIRKPYHIVENDIGYDLNVMTISINGEVYKIMSYNYETGELTLNHGLQSAIEEGTSYQIYANYLITEDYYFKTAMTPVLTNLYANFDSEGIHFTGKCNSLISYYTIKMQKKPYTGDYIDVFETDKIYSSQIQYDFLDDYDHADLNGGNSRTRQYRFIVNAVTRDGFNITGISDDFVMPERASIDIIGNTSLSSPKDSGYIWVDWTVEGIVPHRYRVYRIDATEPYGYNPKKQLVADTSQKGFFDISISKKGKYRYMIVSYLPKDNSDEIDNAVITETIQLDHFGYTISAITNTDTEIAGIPFYLYDSQGRNTWTFLAEVEDTTFTQNLDNTLHVGYGKYSSKTSTSVNYLSGTLSAYLGQIHCPSARFEDDIALVKAWREFISQDCQYILQSPKGDALLVNIVESPTTEYEESNPKLSTKFTFSWAECGSLNDIMINDDIPENTKPIE